MRNRALTIEECIYRYVDTNTHENISQLVITKLNKKNILLCYYGLVWIQLIFKLIKIAYENKSSSKLIHKILPMKIVFL
jgi:hypothetical protein